MNIQNLNVRRIKHSAILLIVCLLVVRVTYGIQPQEEPGTLFGTIVVDPRIDPEALTAVAQSDAGKFETDVDCLGTFTFKELPPGDYQVWIEPDSIELRTPEGKKVRAVCSPEEITVFSGKYSGLTRNSVTLCFEPPKAYRIEAPLWTSSFTSIGWNGKEWLIGCSIADGREGVLSESFLFLYDGLTFTDVTPSPATEWDIEKIWWEDNTWMVVDRDHSQGLDHTYVVAAGSATLKTTGPIQDEVKYGDNTRWIEQREQGELWYHDPVEERLVASRGTCEACFIYGYEAILSCIGYDGENWLIAWYITDGPAFIDQFNGDTLEYDWWLSQFIYAPIEDMFWNGECWLFGISRSSTGEGRLLHYEGTTITDLTCQAVGDTIHEKSQVYIPYQYPAEGRSWGLVVGLCVIIPLLIGVILFFRRR